MPDADPDTTVKIIADSAFGCAGQRCLAASLVMLVGSAAGTFTEEIVVAAAAKKTGNGLEPGVEMGPVITRESKDRINGLVKKGLDEGANLLLDGRDIKVPGFEKGNYIGPTILGNVNPGSDIYNTEVFGPVLCIVNVKTLDEAITLINKSRYGNSACIFTSSGAASRKFRHDTLAGNIGINIGIAAPMAFFPFSGWKNSFFGDLHGQGKHAIEFFTQTKVIIERWPKDWTRKF
jgi:malonate-semialdehyde dehydrogenase (acetylating)/methylmalonate-semialdehyde dehydrogenase